MNTTRGRGRPRALTDEAIARAVLDVGFSELTFGAVREKLGVGESTLYRYAPDRDALVSMAMEQVLNDAEWPSLEGEWRAMLAQHARTVWHLLEQHPGAATEAGRGVFPPRMMQLFTDLAGVLVENGFAPDDAVLACDLVMDLVTDHRQGVERRATSETVMPRSSTRPDVLTAIHTALTGEPLVWFENKLGVVLDGIQCSLAPK